MGLPSRLRGRLSPFFVAVIAALTTGYDAVIQRHSDRGFFSIHLILFALSLALVAASLLIKPNLK